MLSRFLTLSGAYEVNRTGFPGRGETFTAHVGSALVRAALNTRWSLASVVQLDSAVDVGLLNPRLRYNPREGSDFYLVLNEGFHTDRLVVSPRARSPVSPVSWPRTPTRSRCSARVFGDAPQRLSARDLSYPLLPLFQSHPPMPHDLSQPRPLPLERHVAMGRARGVRTGRLSGRLAAALTVLLVAAPAALAQPSDPYLARAERLLARYPVIDGHNDLPWTIRESRTAPGDVAAYDLRRTTPGMTDLPRLARGHVGGQFWSVYTPGEREDGAYAPQGTSASAPGYARVQLEQIDIARRMMAAYPELVPARSAAELRAARAAGKIGSVLGMEGGHAIENSLGVLRAYGDLGVRYMTLTHNVTLDWVDAALDSARHGGLTPFGREVVREMNRIGMLVDLSHVSPASMSDALDATEAPVIFSHSSARAVTDVARNVPDSILRRMPANGGVVMVTFVPPFVSQAVADWEAARDAAVRSALAAR